MIFICAFNINIQVLTPLLQFSVGGGSIHSSLGKMGTPGARTPALARLSKSREINSTVKTNTNSQTYSRVNSQMFKNVNEKKYCNKLICRFQDFPQHSEHLQKCRIGPRTWNLQLFCQIHNYAANWIITMFLAAKLHVISVHIIIHFIHK